MRAQIAEILQALDRGSHVLDVGCAGFAVKRGSDALGRTDLMQAGVDYADLGDIPSDFRFLAADLNIEAIPAPDDSFDFIVAGHIIEHIADPVRFLGDVLRVLKPGGRLYIEAPSERSMMVPAMGFAFDQMRCLSFWDDPTHIGRPWPPQALYRLALCFDCEPLAVGYHTSLGAKLKALVKIPLGLIFRRLDWVETGVWSLVGWASYAVIRKPFAGKPRFHYHMRPAL
jgi:SAM-dependent methyltransferase